MNSEMSKGLLALNRLFLKSSSYLERVAAFDIPNLVKLTCWFRK